MPAKKKTFTITEAAKRLGISRAAVHKAIQEGRLEAKEAKIIKTIVHETTGWVITAAAISNFQVSVSHQTRGKKIDIG